MRVEIGTHRSLQVRRINGMTVHRGRGETFSQPGENTGTGLLARGGPFFGQWLTASGAAVLIVRFSVNLLLSPRREKPEPVGAS